MRSTEAPSRVASLVARTGPSARTRPERADSRLRTRNELVTIDYRLWTYPRSVAPRGQPRDNVRVLTCSTAGESHGPGLIALVTGLPYGSPVDLDFINDELRRRQGGYGRGPRMRMEEDRAEVISGVRQDRKSVV